MSANRSKWILPVAVIAPFAIVAAVLLLAREPRIDGRSASDWFAHAQRDRVQLAESGAAFVRMEAAGSRYLIRKLTTDPPAWKRTLITLFNQYAPKAGLPGIRPASGYFEKQTARKLLGYFEDRVAPELLELLATPAAANRVAALQALAELGPAVAPLAGPQLVPLLNDANDEIVFEAITTLAVIGYDPGSVVPRLVPFLAHGNNRVRLEATYALGSYPPFPAITLDPLIAALKDPDRVVRANAARALGGLGREAGPALEALGEHLETDPLVAARAVEALAMIAGKDAPTMGDAFETAHAAQLAGQDRYNRLMVLRASNQLGRPVNELEAVADTLLDSQANWQVWEAVDALAELEPRPAWAVTLLEQATRHSNGLVRAKARAALGK